MTCYNCNGTKRALYFSEMMQIHEIRDCHLCRNSETGIPSNLAQRCTHFKENHDMGYSADDLYAFVLTEIEYFRTRSD